MRNTIHTIILTAVLLLLSLSGARSQWYTINDPGFMLFLFMEYPEIMDWDQLNTDHPAIQDITHMTIPGMLYPIQSLDGLQHFHALQVLVIQSSLITDINFPPGLLRLELHGAAVHVSSLQMPGTLRKIHLEGWSELSSLEPFLYPDGLEYIFLEDAGVDLIQWEGMTNSLDTLRIQNSGHMFFSTHQIGSWPTELKYLHLGGDGNTSPIDNVPDLYPTQLEYVLFRFPVTEFSPDYAIENLNGGFKSST